MEIAPSVTVSGNLHLRGSYSFFSADLTRRPGIPSTTFTTQIDSGSPRHQAVAQALLTAGGFDISPSYRYVSSRRATEIPGYHELDLPVSWRANPRLTFSLVGQNLLNAHHPEWARDPGPTVEIRRSVYAGLTWTP
jgi:iron complex outermembrane receptor protein